ncbi:MAG: hypothetical protein KGI97_03415 [Alphaproteobacteria bacterium]|nr:hypothetical protein [Alphaproteobacteria bacterium]
MKRIGCASLIVVLMLAGCDSLGLPNIFASDQVPQTVKDQPRAVSAPPPLGDNTPWPRLGDVPFKPMDFTPLATSDRYMNEMSADRAAAQKIEQETDTQNETQPQQFVPQFGALKPPQFPKGQQ